MRSLKSFETATIALNSNENRSSSSLHWQQTAPAGGLGLSDTKSLSKVWIERLILKSRTSFSAGGGGGQWTFLPNLSIEWKDKMRPFSGIVVSTQHCKHNYIKTFYQLHNLIKAGLHYFCTCVTLHFSCLCNELCVILQKKKLSV